MTPPDLFYPITSFSVCILILICDRVHVAVWRSRDRSCTATAQAEITDVHTIWAGTGYRRRRRYRVLARYCVDGSDIAGSSYAVQQCRYRPGDKVMVRYDPSRPMSFLLPGDGGGTLKRQTMYDLVVAGVFFLLGWVLFLLMPK